jgi:hypothetical protein
MHQLIPASQVADSEVDLHSESGLWYNVDFRAKLIMIM